MNGRSTPAQKRESGSFPAPATANGTSIKVVVRIRPPTEQEPANRFQKTVIHSTSSTTLSVHSTSRPTSSLSQSSTKQAFTFDRVINPDETQEDVYETTESLVGSFLTGFNSSIIAYGQTSSGKSYTMGTSDSLAISTQTTPSSRDDDDSGRLGIAPRAIAVIFDKINESTGTTTFVAKVSYIEIYNEDLIDLLVEEGDARPAVTIREDKSGNIIWSGLKEIKVSSAEEVMQYLAAGSAIRQTGATSMNSTSSRSHAIFSLALTQRRYTGSGTPTKFNPSTPSRRISAIPRAGSPEATRSSTPDRPNSRFGLRPQSVNLSRVGTPLPSENGVDGVDSWSTVTSRMNFVDLAGSERLKRTSAAGERVKEGISINSGLHALGNCISALGDTSKARNTTHVPYRDSKLTRLLQDSLGGNAQTIIVACVSPAELNLNETLSTLNYANRARNIQNRAQLNEVEVGWEDVEYLQRTITKLRAEMTGVRGGGDATSMGAIEEEGANDLNSKYSDLTQRFAQLTAELATARATTPSASALSRQDFASAVEPIVEEYERSLSALESQLSLTKAALGLAEEELTDLESRLGEEQSENATSEEMISQLKARIGKSAEREITTEAYVRDLEAKLTDYGEHDAEQDRHGLAVSDLRKELTKQREKSEVTERYVKDLESRLAASEESVATFQRQVEVLERDITRREEAYHDLEGRLAILDTSGDHKLLLAELDERDRRILDLERNVDDLKSQHAIVEQEGIRLASTAAAEKEAKDELVSQLRTLERATLAAAPKHLPSSNFTPPQTPETPHLDKIVVVDLESQLEGLQARYAQTVVDLDLAHAKYVESLKNIESLQEQVDEANLVHSETADSLSTPIRQGFSLSLRTSSENLSSSPSSTSPSTPTSNVGQKSPRSRRSMPIVPATGSSRLSFLGRAGVSPTSSHGRSASLSQELSSATSSPNNFPALLLANSTATSTSTSPDFSSFSMQRRESLPSPQTRSYESLKSEVMNLQTALKEREEEITGLESQLQMISRTSLDSTAISDDSRHLSTRSASPTRSNRSSDNSLAVVGAVEGIGMSPRTEAMFDSLKRELGSGGGDVDAETRLDNLMRSMALKESAHREVVEKLEDYLSTLQRQLDESTIVGRDQVINMSSEIASLRQLLDTKSATQTVVNDDLLQSMQDQLGLKSTELEQLRTEAQTKLDDVTSALESKHAESTRAIVEEHAALLESVRAEHSIALSAVLKEKKESLRVQGIEHAAAVVALIASHGTLLAERDVSHSTTILSRSAEFEEKKSELEKGIVLRESEKDVEMVRLAEEHAKVLESLGTAHRSETKELEEGHAAVLEETRVGAEMQTKSRDSEHQLAIEKLSEQHLQAISTARQVAEEDQSNAVSTISKLLESHATALTALSAKHTQARDEQDGAHATLIEERTAAYLQQLTLVETERDASKSLQQELVERTTHLEKTLAVVTIERDELSTQLSDLVEQQNHLQSRQLDTVTSSSRPSSYVPSVMLPSRMSTTTMSRSEVDEENEDEDDELALALRESEAEREALLLELAAMREKEGDRAREEEDSRRKMEEELTRTKEERDRLSSELSRLSISISDSTQNRPTTPIMSLGFAGERSKMISPTNSPSSAFKAHPPTPPPSMPPPPLPLNNPRILFGPGSPSSSDRNSSGGPGMMTGRKLMRTDSGSSSVLTSIPQTVTEESTTVSVRSTDSVLGESKLVKQLEEENQTTRRLLAQLQHCETDLQANIDLVNTLEQALNDSERNLRQTRNQLTEFSKERAAYIEQNEQLRRQIEVANVEVENVRLSVLRAGTRLKEERMGKDKAKADLETRLTEVQGRKKSKFNCF